MAPHSEEVTLRPADGANDKDAGGVVKEESSAQSPPSRIPLNLKGVLDHYKSFDVTPVIGKEFPEAKLDEWLRAPNSDELLRDLAITSL